MKYSTNFPVDENPISESGSWINGLTTGLDWTAPKTQSGGAYGTEDPAGTDFTDSIATLAGLGTWGWHQRCRGTLKITNQTNEPPFIEAELLLHFSITAHNTTGYELTISNAPNDLYIQINRWNGALGSFTPLTSGTQGNPGFGTVIADGDIFEFRDEGTSSVPLLKVYQNGILLTGLTYNTSGDATKYTGGAPGIGFYNHNSGVPNSFHDYIQWSQFDASDDYFAGELVQVTNTAPSTSANSTALAYTSNVTKSNLLIACCYHAGSNAATFSDTRGNSWTVFPSGGVSQVTDGHHIDLAYAVSKDAGACTVTANHSGDAATQFRSLIVAEFRSGFASDKSHTNTGNGSSAASSGASGTTTNAFELLLGQVGGDNTTASAPTGSPDNFALISSAIGGPSSRWETSLLGRLTYVTGSYTASATLANSENWSALVATLLLSSNQTEINYRFRNDDGSESTATWKLPEMVNLTVGVGQAFRLRFQVDTSGDQPSQPLTLQYRQQGDTAWTSVTTSSALQLSASPNIASGAVTATTQQLTIPSGKSGSDFTAGAISDDTNPINGVDIGLNGFTELEFSLVPTASLTVGAIYEMRLSGTSMLFNTFAIPQILLIRSASEWLWKA